MANNITLEYIEKAQKAMKQMCDGNHNTSITGGCHWCGLIWLGEEDCRNIREFCKQKKVTYGE